MLTGITGKDACLKDIQKGRSGLRPVRSRSIRNHETTILPVSTLCTIVIAVLLSLLYISLVPRPLPVSTLKNWEWPGYKANCKQCGIR